MNPLLIAIELVHVPYRGTGPAATALLAGEVQMVFFSLPPVLQHMRAGKVRALAITGAKRSAVAPDVPTIAESGVQGYEAIGWWGILAPGKTPRQVVATLNTEIVNVLHAEETKAQLSREGIEAVGGSPAQFAAHIRSEGLKWAAVIKSANIKGE